jgi:integrase
MVTIGSASRFPTKAAVWREIERLRLVERINQFDPNSVRAATFAELSASYLEHELGKDSEKSHTTIAAFRRVLVNRLLPHWSKEVAINIKAHEICDWLKVVQRTEKLANPTVDRIRRVMSLVYKNARYRELIPAECNPFKDVSIRTKSDYKPLVITPQQAQGLIDALRDKEPVRTLVLLSALTGLRISESLGLRWADISFERQQIWIRRSWTRGKVGRTKTEASATYVALGPALAQVLLDWRQQTPYANDEDWVFASPRKRGKQPPVANMLVEDYLRPAAVQVGILTKDDRRRFGFHSLRHALSSYLVTQTDTDVRTVQDTLRHSDAAITIGLYTHSAKEDRLAAQQKMLEAMQSASKAVN